MLPRMSSRPLIEPVKDQEMVCPVTSRRRRLRQTVSNNGLEVIRPLGRGSFGRIVLARRVEDGKYYAVKLQRLTGSELTPVLYIFSTSNSCFVCSSLVITVLLLQEIEETLQRLHDLIHCDVDIFVLSNTRQIVFIGK